MHRLIATLAALTLLLGCDANSRPGAARPTGQQAAGDVAAREGHQAFGKQDFAGALAHFQRALELPRQTAAKSEILTSIGNCYLQLDQFDEALRHHDLAIAEDPQNHKAYVNAGVVYRQQGNFAKAREMYNQALAIKPDYAELHASVGALLTLEGKYDEAVRHLERAIQLDPSLPVAHSNLSLAYASVGRFTDADAQLKQAVVLGYQDPEVIQKRIDKLRKAAEKK